MNFSEPKSMKNHFRLHLLLIFLCSFSAKAYGQLNLTVDATTTEATTTLQLNSPEILFLRLNVYDPDYTNEGRLLINGQGPINLFPGGSNIYDGSTVTINVNLNNTQRGYFVQGTNTLTFQYVEQDGFRIEGVIAITEIKEKTYLEIESEVDQPITANRTLALDIYKRLAGIRTPIDNPVIIAMERAIDRGDLRAAAQLASQESSFYNTVVRDFAARMSTRDETINEPLNDFIATFIGVTRDELDARLLLTGNLFYMGDEEAPVARNMIADVLGSNNHYRQLETDNYDIASVLTRVNTQYVRTGSGALANHPDSAGVLTSRAFMGAHAIAGTNRRLVEFTFKQFTCNDIEEWADATATDVRVGRDIDRFPGGEGSKYLTTCKSCHSVMDGFRGAFARYDFSDNFVKYAPFYPNAGGAGGMRQTPMGVSSKMNINDNTFSSGFRTTDDTWVNNAVSPSNTTRFGWRGFTASGSGVRQLATVVANSRAFSKCMVKKVYRELCRRPVANFEQGMVDNLSQTFESDGYNLKKLFENIAVRPECIGVR